MTDTTFPPRTVRAVKPHRCNGCASLIQPGETYERIAGVAEGSFYSVAYHQDCRAHEVELNLRSGFQWDEWTPLGEFVANEGPEALADAPESVKMRFNLEDAR